MPSLFRFLTVVVVLAVLAGAATIYLANFVSPNTREMTIRIPPNKLDPEAARPVTSAPAAPAAPVEPAAPEPDAP